MYASFRRKIISVSAKDARFQKQISESAGIFAESDRFFIPEKQYRQAVWGREYAERKVDYENDGV